MKIEFNISETSGFEWDEANLDHIEKHDVHYLECEEIFANKPIRIREDKVHSHVEKRFQGLGLSNDGRQLFISFTVRKSKIRIVTARDQSKKERKEFRELADSRG